MNPGISYFYEYTNNKKLRNTGFLKTAKQYRTCLLNINIRGISVKSGDSIELYAFFEEKSNYMSKKVGEISCSNKNICSKLSIAEADFPDNRILEKIDGFFLKTDEGQYYATLLNDGGFDTSKIVNWQENQVPTEKVLAADKEAPAEDVLKTDENPHTSSQASSTKMPIFGYAAHSNCQTDWAFKPDPEKVASSSSDPCPTPPTASATAVSTAHNCNSTDNFTAADSPPAATVTKIQRSGLSVLPRKYWGLANNSFLMHGYHNYHHLLLVEEDGHFWIGVPGIYAPREARAAEVFGFPQFTRSYTDLVSLDEDERNAKEDFGYWCRFIHTVHPS